MTDSGQLLTEYSRNGSETAFRELVARYIDLVHSAAVRLVNGDTHLAEDVTQTVFADLARLARKVPTEVMLGGWLHQHTCFVASNIMRTKRRREARERQAVEMNAIEDHSAAHLAQVAPLLDDAINELGAEDRAAILLRFFEQGDFRTVGAALGSTEEAARKRVDRALGKLESLLKQRGVALSATALAGTLATQAVIAAPAGLAASISTMALAGVAAGTASTLTLPIIMSMTKLKIGIASAIVVAGVSIPWILQHRTQAEMDAVNTSYREQAGKLAELTAENERLMARLARVPPTAPSSNMSSAELLKLRGEVGRLRQETAAEKAAAAARANAPSVLGGVTADPEMRQAMRGQQKAAMAMIYKDFAKRLKLSPEQTEKLNELHADEVMENIDRITEALRGNKSATEVNRMFDEQDAASLAKAKALLGPEEFAQYQDYTHNLGSYLTAEQFKSMLAGDTAAKDEKSRLLYQAMQEETKRTLAAAGLPPDFQTVPSLSFRNIASEAEGEKNVLLLDGIYERVQAQAASFLTPEEAAKLAEFRMKAINNNRMALTMNRKMMAPAAK